VQAQRQGDLRQAQSTLARADELNPNNQVSRVLHEEVSSDIALKNDPSAGTDLIEETAALLKRSKNKTPADEWAQRPLVIAFLDFSTLGNSPELAGLHEALVARISQSLKGAKRAQVVDRHLLDKVLQELKLSASDLSDADTRLKVGRILTARLIGTGNVVFMGNAKYVVNLQLIDTETTEIKVNVSEPGNGPEQILQVADKVAADIMAGFAQDYPLRGRIAAIDGEQAILDIGAKAGATVGAQIKAVVEEPIRINGEVVANRMSDLGSMEIVEVHDKVSFAKVIDHKAELTVGTKVIQSAKPVAKADKAAAASAPSATSGGQSG
jgi:TolB-like protein